MHSYFTQVYNLNSMLNHQHQHNSQSKKDSQLITM